MLSMQAMVLFAAHTIVKTIGIANAATAHSEQTLARVADNVQKTAYRKIHSIP